MHRDKDKHDSWPSDGHDHRNVSRDYIYLNTKIRKFLDDDRISLIIANKGMGKTLLMRVKKYILLTEADGSLIIPSGSHTERVEFDEPKIKSTLAQTGFSDLLLWKGLWTTSILLSILSHICARRDHADFDSDLLRSRIDSLDIDATFKTDFLKTIRDRRQYLPSHYLGIFLHKYGEGEIQKFLRTSNVFDDLSTHYITSKVVVLVDAFDQALREAFPSNVDAWKFGQLGLAKAAHSLFTTNHHIKVIATVRQEAWAAFVDDDKEVIEGKSLVLEYNARELETLFDVAVTRYTEASSIREFLGLDAIPNTFCGEVEKPFDYIYRHSAGSPRSLMHFGRALEEANLPGMDESDRAEEIRDRVDATAARTTYDDYLATQKTQFLSTLTDTARLRVLLHLIPSNVLTFDALNSINAEFCTRLELAVDSSHPFCELFNIGLLGRVQQNAASGGEYQYFRKPYEFDWNQREILERDSLYLLHPGLASAVCRVRPINVNRVNVVGVDRKWESKDGHFGVPQVFISYASADKSVLDQVLPRLRHKLNLRFPSDVWFDKWKIRGGEVIHQKIERGIISADIVVLFASKASIASGWVEQEWRTKHREEIEEGDTRLIVVILDETSPSELPKFLQSKLAIVLSDTGIEYSLENLADSVAHHAAAHLARRFPSIGC